MIEITPMLARRARDAYRAWLREQQRTDDAGSADAFARLMTRLGDGHYDGMNEAQLRQVLGGSPSRAGSDADAPAR